MKQIFILLLTLTYSIISFGQYDCFDQFGNPIKCNETSISRTNDFKKFANRTGTAIQTTVDTIGTFQGCKKIVVVHLTDLATTEKMNYVELLFNDCYFNGSYWEYPTSKIRRGNYEVKKYQLDSIETVNLLKLISLVAKNELVAPTKITFKSNSGLSFHIINNKNNASEMFFHFAKDINDDNSYPQTKCDEGYHWDGKNCVKNSETQCDKGYHWDGKNCVLDKQTVKCPDGSFPDWNGNCPTAKKGISKTKCDEGYHWDGKNCVKNKPTTTYKCPDGSLPDWNGNCPTRKQGTTYKCPGEFLPDWNGNCPTLPITMNDIIELKTLLENAKSKL